MITPALTVVMDAYAVIHMGAIPVFVDVDRNTYCISVQEIQKNIIEMKTMIKSLTDYS